jgi:hypothetical protein
MKNVAYEPSLRLASGFMSALYELHATEAETASILWTNCIKVLLDPILTLTVENPSADIYMDILESTVHQLFSFPKRLGRKKKTISDLVPTDTMDQLISHIQTVLERDELAIVRDRVDLILRNLKKRSSGSPTRKTRKRRPEQDEVEEEAESSDIVDDLSEDEELGMSF